MEALLEGKSESQARRNQSFLADTLRGLLGSTTPEQNFLLRHLEDGQWMEALIQYGPAFNSTAFESTENGIALKSLLFFKAGMPVAGLEELFSIQEPKKIHFQLINEWREAAKEDHKAWFVARLNWSQGWGEIFGRVIEVRVLAADLSLQRSVDELNALAMKAPVNSKERALIDWHLALGFAMKDQSDKAAKIMAALLKAPNNPIPTDLMNITAARMLYQNGYLDAAGKYFDKVPKSSEYYFTALEEKSWAHVRKGEPQNALAVTQTLVNPNLTGQIGPESWLVRGLSQLKVCDYPAVLETLKNFPKDFKGKAVYLETISNQAEDQHVKRALAEMSQKTLTTKEIVGISKLLPRTMVRDEKLRFLLSAEVLLKSESDAAEKIYAKSLQQTGLQSFFDRIKNQTNQRMQMAVSSSLSRVKEIAQLELAEIKKVLNKLKIIEVEVIQQVQVVDRLKASLKDEVMNLKVGTTGSKKDDALKFPLSKEFWFDELTNYKVDIKKGCQARKTQ
jgi:tetratricopeptide (TPR) repeat protein